MKFSVFNWCANVLPLCGGLACSSQLRVNKMQALPEWNLRVADLKFGRYMARDKGARLGRRPLQMRCCG
jgi:hypothetical protein